MYQAVNRIVMKEGCRHCAGKDGVPDDKEDVCLTQMSAAKGIRTFGDKAIQALLSKFGQLDEKRVVEPLDPEKISFQQKKYVLCAVSFLKEKRCGCLKGRTCADGSN